MTKMNDIEYKKFCDLMKQDCRDEGITYEMNYQMCEDALSNYGNDPQMDSAISYLKGIGVSDIVGRLADDITP